MLIAAAANTAPALTRLEKVPGEFWVKCAIGIAVILAVVFLLRKLAGVNKVVLGVVTAVFLAVLGFSWIYERNEPTWATPAVRFLADFLPSKGKLAQR